MPQWCQDNEIILTHTHTHTHEGVLISP